jgi:hypothetical protein
LDACSPCQRSRSLSVQPRRPSSSRSWAGIVHHSSLPAAVPPRPSPRCCEEVNVSGTSDSLFQSQVALVRMELLQLVDARVEEPSRPFREEVVALKLLLARVGDSLELTGGLGHAPVQASFPLDSTEQKSTVVEEEHLYGCISPRGNPCQSPDTSQTYL